jgi:Zn-dependent oligopeptidase
LSGEESDVRRFGCIMVGGYAKDETVRRTDRTDETETHQEQHGKQKLLRFSRSHIPVNWRAKDARKRIINNQSTINQSINQRVADHSSTYGTIQSIPDRYSIPTVRYE